MSQKQTAPKALECILCGRCLSVCPVFLSTGREELSPKAKQHMLKKLGSSDKTLSLTDCRALANQCLSCGKCHTTCPQNLSVPKVLADLRATHPNWQQWVWKQWIERGATLWPLLSTFGKLAPQMPFGPEKLDQLMSTIRAMSPDNDAQPWLEVASFDAAAGEGKPILLFAGCTARRIQKQWKAKSENILTGLGYTVLPETSMTCCGLTLDHAGIPDAALTSRQKNLDAWRAAGRPAITTFCATCFHGLKEYPDAEGLVWEEDEQQLWHDALTPLSTLWGKTRFTFTTNAPAHVRYHQPCHWGKNDADKEWLLSVLGEQMSFPQGAMCCGMGGILQLADQPLSRTVADRCWDRLAKDNSYYPVITGCSGCTLQLRGTAPEKTTVMHWLDIIKI